MSDKVFHFFTLVTRNDQYDEMRDSLAKVGFDEGNSIFTVLDNREGNAHEPYSGITEAVRTAQAPYVVFCHQDLVFYHGPEALLTQIKAIEALDPKWAVLGNTGYGPDLECSIRVDDGNGSHTIGPVPARVISLDENFLLIRRDSRVGCSPGMSGFHLYGTDLCLNAYLKGFSAWVIDFRVLHKANSLDYAGLHRLAPRFHRIWRKKISGAVISTSCMFLVFSRDPFLFRYANRHGVHELHVSTGLRKPRTLDYLLRHGRPTWLPMARYKPEDPRGPRLVPAVRKLDALLRRGRPMWPTNAIYDEVEPPHYETSVADETA